MERPEGSNEMPPGMGGSSAANSQSFPASSASVPKSTPAPSKSAPAPTPAPAAEPESKEEAMDVDDDDAKAKKTADEAKQAGNVAYKARRFDEAIEHYNKAWETWPKDVTYLTNLSGELARTRRMGSQSLRQLSTLSRETTRRQSRLARKLSTRLESFEPISRFLPSESCTSIDVPLLIA